MPLQFGKILAATVDGKPITKFASHDEGYVQVVDAVVRAIDNMEAKNTQQDVSLRSQITTFSSAQETGSILTPRSSNLSLPKSFTDLDKDRACREGFEYVTRYFENSLSELKKQIGRAHV